MSNNSRLTLFILSYNRMEYLLRQMKFWSGRNVEVHVLDGSDKPISIELACLKDNIHYHYLPLSASDRHKKIIDLPMTEYSAYLGDDDFFLPSALESCLSYLDHNKGVVSCAGRCIGFELNNKQLVGFNKFPIIKKSELSSSSAFVRVQKKAKCFIPSLFFSVMRTDLFIENIKLIGEQYSSPYPNEIVSELSCAIHGKTHIIDELMWLRSCEEAPVQTDEHDRNCELSAWYHDVSLQQEVDDFVNSIVCVINESKGISKITLKNIVYMMLNTMCGMNYRATPFYAVPSSLISLVVYKLELIFDNNCYSNYGDIDFSKYEMYDAIRKNLVNNGVYVNYDDLNDAVKSINSMYFN